MSFIRTTVSCLAILFAAHASADFLPALVPVSFDRIYAPDGFDDNDNVQIIGEGFFPNSCYRYAKTKVQVNHTDKIIALHSFAYKYDGICLQVMVPYNHSVDLGILRAGDYTIVRGADGKQLGKMTIKPSRTNDPDDHLYAPISQAFFTSKNGNGRVDMTGNFPLSCMRIKEVKADVQANVLLIQPIAVLDSSTPCIEGTYAFKTRVEIPFLKNGRYFLHVRSMNNKSLNSLVDAR